MDACTVNVELAKYIKEQIRLKVIALERYRNN